MNNFTQFSFYLMRSSYQMKFEPFYETFIVVTYVAELYRKNKELFTYFRQVFNTLLNLIHVLTSNLDYNYKWQIGPVDLRNTGFQVLVLLVVEFSLKNNQNSI